MPETVIRQDHAPRFGDEGTAITGYASPTRGSATVSAWKVELQPGASSPDHELTHGEAFVVLSGRATFEVEGRRHVLAAGDAICVPPDTEFHLANEDAEPFSAICCMAAGGQARIGDGAPMSPPWAL